MDDIMPGSPLARTLDNYPAPPLSNGFSDRVLAVATARGAPLPELRRKGGGRGWRLGRRLAIGAACFGALATAAAATGVLDRFDISVPSADKVWARLTGKEVSTTSANALPLSEPSDRAAITTAPAPVVIDGPIDTPEELGEAFRRIDEVRQRRIEGRREQTGQRIDRAIERRREVGLPVPTPEQAARLRQRIDAAEALRQQRTDQRIAERRTELERMVESGAALTPEDIKGFQRNDRIIAERRARLKELRQMTPQQRRDVLRGLPPEQRRALIEEYPAQPSDAETLAPEAAPAPLPLDSASPERPSPPVASEPQ